LIIAIIAFIAFLVTFYVTDGHSLLFGEVKKMTQKEKRFSRFTTQFHKTYPNETEKERRMEIYSANQEKMFELNGVQIGYNTTGGIE